MRLPLYVSKPSGNRNSEKRINYTPIAGVVNADCAPQTAAAAGYESTLHHAPAIGMKTVSWLSEVAFD